jgi:hypothetical protein
MVEDKKALEQAILVQVVRLNAVASGVVTGLVAGLALLAATLWLVIKGGPVVGPHLGLLGQFFPGYSVTWLGALVGFGYAFLIGFLVGYFVAAVYNWLVHLRDGQATGA